MISSYSVLEYSLAVLSRARDKLKERHRDPLGLTVVHEPDGPTCLNIIFVHGLGGASRKTWSKNQNPELFWPGRWLPLEDDISRCRILSFGYNAYFMSSGPSSNTNILDFAKELLYDMRFGKDESGKDLNIGQVCQYFILVTRLYLSTSLGSCYIHCAFNGRARGKESRFCFRCW